MTWNSGPCLPTRDDTDTLTMLALDLIEASFDHGVERERHDQARARFGAGADDAALQAAGLRVLLAYAALVTYTVP